MLLRSIKIASVLVLVAIAFAWHTKVDLYSVFAEDADAATMSALSEEIGRNFQARSTEFTVTYEGDNSQLSEQLPALIRQSLEGRDYVAYVLDSYVYTIRSWGDRSTIQLHAKYRESEEQTKVVQDSSRAILSSIIHPEMTQHEKVKAIHDYVVGKLEYDQSLQKYTAYEAVTEGTAVCQGYALLGYQLLKDAGLKARIVEGTVNTGDHAWNLVQIDGQWYHLDLTWDDPVTIQQQSSDGSMKENTKPDVISYRYYLLSDEQIRKDHSWTRDYPQAPSSYKLSLDRAIAETTDSAGAEKLQLLKQQVGLHWEEAAHTIRDAGQLRAKVQKAVASGADSMQFRYLNGEGLEADLREAVERASAEPVALSSYNAQYEPFGNDGSVLVTLQFND
ncbi:transglutaminase domain-containing protein [Paenibacillus sp. GCM10023252]|uniref:transglutaminase domain-containing protein n=1 Tax=Paenibacillus sp. GCM10023252 TaxID=3252649 RepID=UPI0036095D6A